jgi:predicted deacylase
MNQAEFFIQAPSTGTVHLRRAVLIYDGQQGSALATVHDIEEVDGEAVIGAGQAMTPGRRWTLPRRCSSAPPTAVFCRRRYSTWMAT